MEHPAQTAPLGERIADLHFYPGMRGQRRQYPCPVTDIDIAEQQAELARAACFVWG